MKVLGAILAVFVIAVSAFGQVQYENVRTLRIDAWSATPTFNWYSTTPELSRDMMNFDVREAGGKLYLKKRAGYKIALDSVTSSISGTYDLFVAQIVGDSERVYVARWNGELFTATDGPWTDLTEGATVRSGDQVDEYTSFVVFKDTLLFTGKDSIFVLNNAGDPPSFISADYFPYGLITLHQDRIYAGGTHDSVRSKVVWMPEFDIDFTGAEAKDGFGFVYVDYDDGDFITAILPLAGDIIVYTGRSIYRLVVSPVSNQVTEVIKITDQVGAWGIRAVTSYNDVHYLRGLLGIYEFNGRSVSKISRPIDRWFSDSLVEAQALSGLFRMTVVGDRLYCMLPKGPLNVVTSYPLFVYDLVLRYWVKYDLGLDKQTALFSYTYSPLSSSPLFGSWHHHNLLLWIKKGAGTSEMQLNLYPFANTDRGGDIAAYFKSSLMPYGSHWSRSAIERVLISARTNPTGGTPSLTIDWYTDGSPSTSVHTTTVSIGNIQTLKFVNKRVGSAVEGSLWGYEFGVTDTSGLEIHSMEVVIKEKGMGNETE